MKHLTILPLSFLFILFGCQQSPEMEKEPWTDKPVNQWPNFALTNEIVYAIGWGALQKDNTHPVKTTFQCFRSLGNYYYAKSLTKNVKPDGRSGSPVIDKNGYLVGITSGAEGKLTVIGSIQYLKHLFDRHQVEYNM